MTITPPTTIPVDFAEPLQILFQPKRYKVLYGGRNAGRSWGVSRALLAIGYNKPIRVLCAREFQNSIGESVHKVLSDQIGKMGLSHFYTVEKAKIYGINGTEFSFEGIKNNTTRIKSYEGIDYCWVEEAAKLRKPSWDILIPTIRKSGSEIWMTFNPELEKDYTYKRFVKDADLSNSFVVKMTYKDNPWLTPEVLEEIAQFKKRDYDSYLNVWEGFCRRMLEGAVFAKELRRAEEDGRITKIPWVPDAPVDTFWDLGRRDYTSIWFAQRIGMVWNIIDFHEDIQEDVVHFLKVLQDKSYVYGTHFLPHDATHMHQGMKRSIEQTFKRKYPDTKIVPRTSKKVNGINAVRMIFPTCWFDEDKCEEGLDRLRHYHYKVMGTEDEKQLSEEPDHDENSHAADAFMTFGQSARAPKSRAAIDEFDRQMTEPEKRSKLGQMMENVASGLGWMGN